MDVVEIWEKVLPDIRDGVTGVGVWTALNACTPIAFEEDTLVIGVPSQESELAGHLRLPSTKRTIETIFGDSVSTKVHLRVISGVTAKDWETEKRRDRERRKLQEDALERSRVRATKTGSWDTIHDRLARMYAETPNRSLPQNRARYLMEAIDLLSSSLQETPLDDDASERSFARCIERVAQSAEIPSALVASKVLEKAFGE